MPFPLTGKPVGRRRNFMINFAEVFTKAKQRKETEREIVATLPLEKQSLYMDETKEATMIYRDMKMYCRKMLLFTMLSVVVQLEIISSRFTAIYDYVTLPIYVKILQSLMAIVNHWALILAIIIGVEIILRFKRPLIWEKFLLKAPFIRKVMLPLCYYRYYLTKSFGISKDKAAEATGNNGFNTDDETIMGCIKEDYPLFHATTTMDKNKHKLRECEYEDIIQYSKRSLEFATFEFKEIFSYACMGFVFLITIVAFTMLFDAV